MNADLVRLGELAAAATPGERKAIGNGVTIGDDEACQTLAILPMSIGNHEADAEFIAACDPSTIAGLVQRVQATLELHRRIPVLPISDDCEDPSHEEDWTEADQMNDLICPRCEPIAWSCWQCGDHDDDPCRWPCATWTTLTGGNE